MRMSEDGPLQPTPLWEREDLSPGGLVREFLRECRIVRKGLDGSLFKVPPGILPPHMHFAKSYIVSRLGCLSCNQQSCGVP